MTNHTIIAQLKTQYKMSLIVRSPGRINLIGEHTDYNDGFVLPAAIDKALYFGFRPKKDSESIQIEALAYGEKMGFRIGKYNDVKANGWAAYFQAALQELEKRGFHAMGFDCVFGGDIPIGAGLSSSAALCCGFVFGVATLHGWRISRVQMAKIAQATEHRIGLNCGLMDQYAVLFGKANHAISLDCENLAFEYVPAELGKYSLVMINSGVQHQLASESGYNERRASCERVVACIQKDMPSVQTLRGVTTEILATYQPFIRPIDYQRAAYVLAENNRVQMLKTAWLKSDLPTVGAILFEAHEAMRTGYEITTPELDLLVDLAKKNGAIGARMMGGGFGGCTISLLPTARKTEILDAILTTYKSKTAIVAEVYAVKMANGVGVVTKPTKRYP